MANYLLVHGAWHGAWCWRRVLPPLTAAGHRVHALTLTGVGERAHLLGPAIDLETHIADVTAAMDAEEMDEVILVVHSYAGMLGTAVADRRPQRLRHLVYLDAVLPKPGESWSSTHSAETIAARLQAAAASGGLTFPPPDASVFGLDGADRDWVNRRQTPQPAGVYQDRLDFDAARIATLPRTFIDCTSPALATIAPARERVRREPGWQLIEMATGHDPMVSDPQGLSRHLLTVWGQAK